jgi:dipeptidyl aminopeptidase/acylaminoacyl peptidase
MDELDGRNTMKHIEDSVRSVVEELADTAPFPAGLADVARTRGRRIRRRRRAVVGLVAVALVGTVVTPYAVLDERRGAPRPVPVAPTPSESPAPRTTSAVPYVAAAGANWWTKPLVLPGDLAVTGLTRKSVVLDANGVEKEPAATPREGNVVLDRAAGSYRMLSSGYQALKVAPTGRYALVESGTTARVGIADTTTGRVRMLDHGSGSGVEWSPDGEQLLLTLNAGGFRVIDAATAESRDRDIPESRELCPDYCFFTWLPGGQEVALAQRDPDVEQSESRPDTVKSIKVYAVATGKLVRELPVPGVPESSAAWSPDGRHVLLGTDASSDSIRIVEVPSGRTVATVNVDNTVPVRFVGNDTVLGVAGRDAYFYDLSGRLKLRMALPAEFADREISFGKP